MKPNEEDQCQIPTDDGGDLGGYGWYHTESHPTDEGFITTVEYKGCDTSKDGRRILVNLYQDGDPVAFAVDKNGADNGCGPTEVEHLSGLVAMRVCRQDWDLSRASTRLPTDCSPKLAIA